MQSENMKGALSINWIIAAVIGMLIFFAFVPTLADSAASAIASGNLTAADIAMLGIFMTVIIAVAIKKTAY